MLHRLSLTLEIQFAKTSLNNIASSHAAYLKPKLKKIISGIIPEKQMRRLIMDCLLQNLHNIGRSGCLDAEDEKYIIDHYDDYIKLFLQALTALFENNYHAGRFERPFSSNRYIKMQPVTNKEFCMLHWNGPITSSNFRCDVRDEEVVEGDELLVEYLTKDDYVKLCYEDTLIGN